MKLSILSVCAVPALAFAQSEAPIEIAVTDTVLRPASAMEPLGVNNFGDSGGIDASRRNILSESGFEPVQMRDLYRVIESGKDEKGRWVTLDGPGTSNWRGLF